MLKNTKTSQQTAVMRPASIVMRPASIVISFSRSFSRSFSLYLTDGTSVIPQIFAFFATGPFGKQVITLVMLWP